MQREMLREVSKGAEPCQNTESVKSPIDERDMRKDGPLAMIKYADMFLLNLNGIERSRRINRNAIAGWRLLMCPSHEHGTEQLHKMHTRKRLAQDNITQCAPSQHVRSPHSRARSCA